MSENIDIIITDQVASTISEKISAIAAASDVAFTNVEKLKSALNGIGVSKVNELKDAVDKLSTSHKEAKSALDLHTDSWLNHIKTVAGGIIVYQGIREAMRLVIGLFTEGVKAVDEYQTSVIQLAAIYTTLAVDKINIAGNYIEAKRYAEALMPTLMEIDKATTLNLGNLIKITEEFAKQGIALNATNKDQVEGFTRIANAVALYSRNGADSRQVQQEIRAMIQGQSRDSDQLGKLLKSILGDSLKPTLENWREQGKTMGDSGFIIQKIGELLKGFGPATKDMAGTWGAVTSSMKTTFDIIARETFTPILKDWITNLDELNVYLRENKAEIADTIQNAWGKLKTAIDDNKDSVIKFAKEAWETTKQLAEMGSTLLGIVNTISSVPEIAGFGLVGYFLFGKTGLVVGAVAGMVDGILSETKNKIQGWAYENGIQVNQWNQQRIQQDRKVVPNTLDSSVQNDPGMQAFLDRNAANPIPTALLTPSQQASTAWADATSKAMQGLTTESGKLGFALEHQQEVDKKAIKLAEQQATARDKLSESVSKIIDKENEATKTWGTFRVAFNTLNDALDGTKATGYKAAISLEAYNNGIKATQERIKDMIDKPFDAITNAMKKVDDPFAKFTEALAKIESTGKDYLTEIIKDTEEVKNQTQQGKLSKEQEKIALQTLQLEATEVSKKMKEASSATIDAMQRELATKNIYTTVTTSNADKIRAEVQKMTENQKLYTQSMSIAGEAAGLTTGFITDMGKAFVEFNKQGPVAKDTILGLSYVMSALGNQLGGRNGTALQDIGKGLTALNSQQDTSGLSGSELNSANQANTLKQISGYGAIANGVGQMIGGSTGKGISTTANYATTGAIIGSVIPGIGTVAGAIVGGIGGLVSSLFGTGPSEADNQKSAESVAKTVSQMALAGNALAQSMMKTADYSTKTLADLDSRQYSGVLPDNVANSGYKSDYRLITVDAQGKGSRLTEALTAIQQIEDSINALGAGSVPSQLATIEYKWQTVIALMGNSAEIEKARINELIIAVTGISATSLQSDIASSFSNFSGFKDAGTAAASKINDEIVTAIQNMTISSVLLPQITAMLQPVLATITSKLIEGGSLSADDLASMKASFTVVTSSIAPLVTSTYDLFKATGMLTTAQQSAITKTTENAGTTTTLINNLSSLQSQYDNLTMTTVQLREKEIATLDPASAALQRLVYSLEDAKTAADAAAAATKANADQNYSLTTQILTLQGKTSELRARELALISDPVNKALQQQIFDLQDLAASASKASTAVSSVSGSLGGVSKQSTALAAYNSAVQSAMDQLTKSVNTEKALNQTKFNDASKVINDSLTKVADNISKLTSFNNELQSTLDKMSPTGANDSIFKAAQSQIFNALDVAKKTGVLPTDGSLSGAMNTVSQISTNNYSNRFDYQKDYYKTTGALLALKGLGGSQLTDAQQQQVTLENQLKTLTDGFNAGNTRLDSLIALAQKQVDISSGTYKPDQSVSDASKKLLKELNKSTDDYTRNSYGPYTLSDTPSAQDMSLAMAQKRYTDMYNNIYPSSVYRNSGEPYFLATTTHPSSVYNTRNSQDSTLLVEIQGLRSDLQNGLTQVAKNTGQTSDKLDTYQKMTDNFTVFPTT